MEIDMLQGVPKLLQKGHILLHSSKMHVMGFKVLTERFPRWYKNLASHQNNIQ